MLELDLKRVLAYPLSSVPLTFAHIDGLKISTDNSTLFSKLEVRIIAHAPRNIQLLSKIFIDSDFCHNYLHTLYLFACLL